MNRRSELVQNRHATLTGPVCDVVVAAAAAAAAIVVARSLGPAGRGEYASIIVWFGVLLVAGELGQTAATSAFLTRDARRGPDYLATSRNLMVVSGAVALAVGMAAAPFLGGAPGAATSGHRIMFATCLAGLVGAIYLAGLQASDVRRWNRLRTGQPLIYFAVVTVLHRGGWLDLTAALLVLSGTIWAQALLGYRGCARLGLTGGRGRLGLARPMTRRGLGQLAVSAPALLAVRLDQLVLSVVAAPAVLGNYAVAASLAAVAVPITAALSRALLPSRAVSPSRPGAARLRRRSLAAGAAIAVSMVVPLASVAYWLVPAVFGAGFTDAVWLVLLLAPGGIFRSCGQVCAELLRGYRRPVAVARAQSVSVAVLGLLLAALVPPFGATGAALAASTAAGVALLIMLRQLTVAGCPAGGTEDHAPPPGGPRQRSPSRDRSKAGGHG